MTLPVEIVRGILAGIPEDPFERAKWLVDAFATAEGTLLVTQRIRKDILQEERTHEQRMSAFERELKTQQDNCGHLAVAEINTNEASELRYTKCLVCWKEW